MTSTAQAGSRPAVSIPLYDLSYTMMHRGV